jgi:hypothetical protein
MTLQRLVIETKSGELVISALYRIQDGPNPGTKARQLEVTEPARPGLQDALEALEGGVEIVGTSGFTRREDVLLATTSSDTQKLVKGA